MIVGALSEAGTGGKGAPHAARFALSSLQAR